MTRDRALVSVNGDHWGDDSVGIVRTPRAQQRKPITAAEAYIATLISGNKSIRYVFGRIWKAAKTLREEHIYCLKGELTAEDRMILSQMGYKLQWYSDLKAWKVSWRPKDKEE